MEGTWSYPDAVPVTINESAANTVFPASNKPAADTGFSADTSFSTNNEFTADIHIYCNDESSAANNASRTVSRNANAGR